ncbi:30S ribosomal protein S17 [Methylococcus capsulatus]|jgi:small subunit ribosomal protein S17|uniref:Small ribosomal subunit protein uS17 n=1 Tax=Methylococcus capsulatus TaxID=414 RepID=A0AA35ULI2_METCP|nr:30S ribosomal protein S17 [Methylococcus capsulatus]CAI8835871.1 30S ribosomal subunit protein S17 [Methylococcus capsulatus]
MTASEGRVRSVTGRVVSNKMDRTIVVAIERQVSHPLYGKYIRRTTKVLAHDENNECSIGDLVTLHASRPISKKKAWILGAIVERAV